MVPSDIPYLQSSVFISEMLSLVKKAVFSLIPFAAFEIKLALN